MPTVSVIGAMELIRKTFNEGVTLSFLYLMRQTGLLLHWESYVNCAALLHSNAFKPSFMDMELVGI